MAEYIGVEPAEQAAAIITAAGMPRMPARALMALVAAPAGGYTAAELADRLGVSAGAVSGAVRYLQDAHFIRRLPIVGHRRDRYDLVVDAFHSVVIGNIPVYLHMADNVDRIGAQTSDPAAVERATTMSGFLRFMAKRMPELVAEWEALRADADAIAARPPLSTGSDLRQ
jgi:DNA-binding Lrp family transcriptional regulator